MEIFTYGIIFHQSIRIVVVWGYMDKLVSNTVKTEKKILALLICISFVILFLEYIWYYNYPPFGENSDVYQHLACIREISKGVIPPHNPITASNVPDVHYGPYLVLLGYIFALTQINPIILLYIAGLINLCLFIFFAFKFTKEMLGERIAIFSVMSMLFIWGPLGRFAGVYKIFAAYDFFFPQGIAYTLLFASLYCLIKAKTDKRYMIFSIVLSVLLFTTHLLTGTLYLILVYLFLIADCYKTKFDKSYHLFLIGLPIITFLISLLWPFYPVLDAFLVRSLSPHASLTLKSTFSLSTSPITVPEKYSGNLFYTFGCIFARMFLPPYRITHYPPIAGFACFGIIGLWRLIKERRIFFSLWFFFCFFMVVILAPYYERFFLFSLIPLHIGLGILLDKLFRTEKKFLTYFVISLLVLSFLSTGFVEYSTFHKTDLNYNFIINNTERDSVIMSDKYTSWKIPALTGRKVIYGLHGCGYPNNDAERLNAINTFYNLTTSDKERYEILKKYNVSYVVVNNKTKPLKLFYPCLLYTSPSPRD